MPRIVLAGGFLLAVTVVSLTFSQEPAPRPAPANSEFTADYPTDRFGILIQDSSWSEIASQVPAKTRAAHGFAASLSYGLVPVKIVAEYQGTHAAVSVGAGRPILCICHMMSLPGEPVIVQLHVKKGSRELDGGKMVVYPVVGGSKMADANQSDLIPVDQSHPENHVWLIRPQSPLDPGEYALMLGTQNLYIYPFTVTAPAAGPAGAQ
jgi:hypothetical protein